MKNVFRIRTENENYVVLPTSALSEKIGERAVIIIFLYYENTVSDYFKYMDSASEPNGIDLIVITTSVVIEELVRNRYENILIIRKENRGRDVSALLVAARDVIQTYKYFCFVHDKKVRKLKHSADFDMWVRSMWENTIASSGYIRNVVDYLEAHDNCGLLIPPEPFGDYYSAWFSCSWYENYDITYGLAQKLHLDADINSMYPPISLGTVLWARTDALKKLLFYKWEYTDFMEEPLPYDGTISHAIERIFPYVAQDAGYETKTVMTSDFCATLLAYLQTNAFRTHLIMRRYLEMINVQDMKNFLRYEKTLPQFFDRNEEVYLYGAGKGGKACLYLLRTMGLEPSGFIVSCFNEESSVCGLPVVPLAQTDLSDDTGVIITVIQYEMQQQIINEMSRYPNVEYIVWHDLGE